MPRDQCRQRRVERHDVGQASADDYYVRIEHVDDCRETARQSVPKGFEAFLRLAIAGAGRLYDLLGREPLAGARAIVARNPAAGQERLDATRLAAIALRAGELVGPGPGERVVSPLARDSVVAGHELPVDHDAATDTGAEDDAEHHTAVRTGAIDRLGKRKAVGVVLEPHRLAQSGREVAVERLPNQDGRVGVLDETRRRRDRPGAGYAYAAVA